MLAVSCSVDYPTNSLICSKEELPIFPDAFGNQTLHEDSSTETAFGANYVTQPRIPRKENLEDYSTNLKQIVLSFEEWEKLDHNSVVKSCTPSVPTFLAKKISTHSVF